MTWVTRKQLEDRLRDLDITRYRIIERLGEVQIEVPPKKFYDALCGVGLGGAFLVRVNLVGLAWWRCWFRRQQWVDER